MVWERLSARTTTPAPPLASTPAPQPVLSFPRMHPSPTALATIQRRQRLLRPVGRALLFPRIRLRFHRPHDLPAGPALVVVNHITAADFLIAALAIRRGTAWVGTRTLLDGPLGPVASQLGYIPKTRFAADLGAVRSMLRWLRAGAAVGVFPEGERSWDGRPCPLLPGLDRLIAHRGVPVVPVRLHNAYRVWPRWTSRPRSGTVLVEVGEAWTPPADATADAISAHLQRVLDVPVRSHPELRVRGDFVTGITNVLFRCPACDGDETLVERPPSVRCRACGAHVEVDDQHVLHVAGRELPLEAWMDETRARTLAELPVSGEILGLDGVEVVDHTDGATTRLATGRLALHADALTCGSWRLPLEVLHNANIEYQRILELRTRDRYLKAILPTGSAWRWPWTIRAVQAQRG